MTNKYTKKFKRSKRSRCSKRSLKLRNSLTHRARLNKLQNGGSEHNTKKSKGIEERAAKRRQKLLATAQQQISSQVPVAQPLGSANLESIKQQIEIMRATGI